MTTTRIVHSHEKPRVETPRVRADAKHGVGVEGLPESAPSAPIKDARTGRFLPGNNAWRRRQAKALAQLDLAGLNPATCEPWMRPFAEMAIEHASNIAGELGVASAMLSGLACDTAAACAVFRALLKLGSEGDKKALKEARAWMREHRLNVIALKALAADEGGRRPSADAAADPVYASDQPAPAPERADADEDADDGSAAPTPPRPRPVASDDEEALG